MSKVLIAEGLGYNLLSVSQLMAKGIHLEADSTTQEFKLFHGQGGLYIGKALLKNNVFVLDFVPDLGTADSDGIVTFTSWTHPPDLDPDFSPEGLWYSHTIPEAERTRALATIQHSIAAETTTAAAATTSTPIAVAARDVIFYERLTLPTYLASLEENRDPTGGFSGDRHFASAADEVDWDEQNVDNASEEAGPLPYCSVPIPMDDENPRESVNAETYFDLADTGYVTPAEVNTNEGERIGPNFIPGPETGDEAAYPEDTTLPRYTQSGLQIFGLVTAVHGTAAPKEPAIVQQALGGEHREKWREAMDKELKALQERNTWKIVPIGVAQNKTILTGKWVFRVKTKADGTIDKFKARWVVRGFDQEHGRDFTETFAPVSRHTSLWILLAVAAMKKKKLRQIDVANAFLYAPVDAKIYVKLPHGSYGEPNQVRSAGYLSNCEVGSRREQWREQYSRRVSRVVMFYCWVLLAGSVVYALSRDSRWGWRLELVAHNAALPADGTRRVIFSVTTRAMHNRNSAPSRPAPPPAVRAGDRVSIVAPAGAVDARLLRQGCDVLASWGLVPVVHPQVALRQAYLAGSDRARAAGLVEAFLDPTTRAVVCARGGYGCARLLPLLERALRGEVQGEAEGKGEGEWERGGWECGDGEAELERGAEAVLGEGGAANEGRGDEDGGDQAKGNERGESWGTGGEGKGEEGEGNEGGGESGEWAQRLEGRAGCGGEEGGSGGEVMWEGEDGVEGRADARGDVESAGAGAAGGDGGCRGVNRTFGSSADVARCCSSADVAQGGSRRSRLVTQISRKRFFGFSDVTALHSFFQAELAAPFISFHAPMPATSFFMHQSALASRAALRAALFEPSLPLACPPLQLAEVHLLQKGSPSLSCPSHFLSCPISSLPTSPYISSAIPPPSIAGPLPPEGLAGWRFLLLPLKSSARAAAGRQSVCSGFARGVQMGGGAARHVLLQQQQWWWGRGGQ
ncbi:unnamed protein product [Closterium sp. NIES-53]